MRASQATYRTAGGAVLSGLPDDVRGALARALEAGEQVEWFARPTPGALARGAALVAVLGGVLIVLGAVAIAPTAIVALGFVTPSGAYRWPALRDPLLRASVGLLGAAVATLGAVLARNPLLEARRARGTVYVLTNRRVLVARPRGAGIVIEADRPDGDTRLTCVVRRDGTGDVVLARTLGSDASGLPVTRELRLVAIRDPRAIEARIRALTGAEPLRAAS